MLNRTQPHRRYNALTQEWILVSPHRATRPWLGAVERQSVMQRPTHDPTCYLCPGNTRVNGVVNPNYDSVYVFDNDFPALLEAGDGSAQTPRRETEDGSSMLAVPRPPSPVSESLLRAEQETGVCRVICFSPRHDLTLAQLPREQIRAVVDTWADQCAELGARDDIAYIQLFENKGEIMGASNPHPHGQLWASRHIPTEIAKETRAQREYLDQRRFGEDAATAETGDGGPETKDGSSTLAVPRPPSPVSASAPLLIDYLDLERQEGERIVFENEHFVCLVPWWAVWPFETMLLPRRQVRRIVDLADDERNSLADALKRITIRYDHLFDVSFPYTMGVHQAPYDGEPHEEWQLHIHFYPPLLRSATVKKFMVGYEMLAQPQRDLTAEQAAERLRNLPEM